MQPTAAQFTRNSIAGVYVQATGVNNLTAAHQLRISDTPLARIAEQVGYGSEAAFNRAFKRSFGVPPAT